MQGLRQCLFFCFLLMDSRLEMKAKLSLREESRTTGTLSCCFQTRGDIFFLGDFFSFFFFIYLFSFVLFYFFTFSSFFSKCIYYINEKRKNGINFDKENISNLLQYEDLIKQVNKVDNILKDIT